MSKTNDLRKLIKSILVTIKAESYYDVAPDGAGYPHIVYTMRNVNLGDLSRDDLLIDIDVWDRSTDAKRVEEICDQIDSAFRTQNLPQEHILPTFFVGNRKTIIDEDKKIRHRTLIIEVQNYER